MRQLWKERRVVNLLVEAEDRLETLDDPLKVAGLYIDHYLPKEIATIRALPDGQQKETEAHKLIMSVVTIIDHCDNDKYLELRDDNKLHLTAKGRKFVQPEYFLQAIAEQLGLGLSLLTGLGLGVGIRELIMWIFH